MANLFKQLRSNNPNTRHTGREDKTIPPQKTQSFKGEKKRTPSWIKRQFSGSMSRDNSDSMDEAEYQLAVAAAALAISSLDLSGTREVRRGSRVPDVASTRTKSEIEKTPPLDRRAKSNEFSDEGAKPTLVAPDERVHVTTEGMEKRPMKKKISFADTHMNSSSSLLPERRIPTEKASVPPPAIKKTSTFDNIPDRTRIRKSEIEEQSQKIPAEPKPKIPSPVRPPYLPADNVNRNTKPPGKGDMDAESWEKAELARIREKHEKKKAIILGWEQKKKNKAKRRLDRIEAELDKKRAKAMQHYRGALVRIENIAGGARSQAAENRKKEEFKAKEKADKMRLTGKLPATCSCF